MARGHSRVQVHPSQMQTWKQTKKSYAFYSKSADVNLSLSFLVGQNLHHVMVSWSLDDESNEIYSE